LAFFVSVAIVVLFLKLSELFCRESHLTALKRLEAETYGGSKGGGRTDAEKWGKTSSYCSKQEGTFHTT
jgi:hypothetical protein